MVPVNPADLHHLLASLLTEHAGLAFERPLLAEQVFLPQVHGGFFVRPEENGLTCPAIVSPTAKVGQS